MLVMFGSGKIARIGVDFCHSFIIATLLVPRIPAEVFNCWACLNNSRMWICESISVLWAVLGLAGGSGRSAPCHPPGQFAAWPPLNLAGARREPRLPLKEAVLTGKCQVFCRSNKIKSQSSAFSADYYNLRFPNFFCLQPWILSLLTMAYFLEEKPSDWHSFWVASCFLQLLSWGMIGMWHRKSEKNNASKTMTIIYAQNWLGPIGAQGCQRTNSAKTPTLYMRVTCR